MLADRRLKNPLLLTLALCLLVASVLAAYWSAKRRGLDEMHKMLAPRADFYAATLAGVLSKYEFLPLALAQSAAVADLLQHAASAAQVNAYLENLNQRAGAFAIYVMDPQGQVLASSNWQQPTSYVGQNYAFRPYFQQAMRGQIGHFYGVGVSTREAGLFISQPILSEGRIIGIAAAKVSLDWIEQSWRTPGATEQIWVTDANGVIILSSFPGLKFTSLLPLSPAQRAAITRQRQFLHEPLPAVAHPVREQFPDGAKLIALGRPGDDLAPDGEFLAVDRPLAPLGWKITVLSDLTLLRARASNAALAAALVWCVLLLGVLYARQRRRRIHERLAAQQALRRAYDELDVKVRLRTSDLQQANARLQGEIVERERAEQTLLLAQAELVQSGKLAAIGQMAAGITHELNQPLAAMQTFSDNARVFIARGRTDEALENLLTISDLVRRLGYITSQLKAFARRSDDARRPAHAQKAFAQAILLLQARMRAQQIQLAAAWPQQALIVLCSAIGLEQVFTNLLSNAVDAMTGASHGRIEVEVEVEVQADVPVDLQKGQHDGWIEIRIADTGPGIASIPIEKIFDPFHTTRDQGLGLGLSISAGIVRSAGGSLSVRNRTAFEGGGAQFTIRLACASNIDAKDET